MEMGERMWKEGSCLIAFVWKVNDGIFCTVRFSMCIPSCAESFQFSCSVMSDSETPWTTACQPSLCITNSRSPPKPMSIESVMPSNHLILCRPLLLPPSILPSIRVFSSVSSSHQVAKVLEFQLQHQCFQWTGWTDWISLQS